ncbi:hypothetical protein BH09VER1_BH09VER1_48740 [soil metagenome]
MKPLLLALLFPSLLLAQEKNRFNLPETPAQPRFKVTDQVWPQKPGEADLCLWHDDKLAALSLGVDDNNAGDIDWWKEQAQLHNFRVTWFVITGRVDHNRSVGYWKQFNELQQLGHDIQSHSVTHLHMLDLDWGTPAWNYAKASAALPPPPPRTASGEGADPAQPQPAGQGTSAPKSAPAKSATSTPAPSPPSDGFILPTAPPPAADSAPSPAAPAAPPVRSRYHPSPSLLTLNPEQIATGILWEYQQSKAQIEQHMPDKLCSVLAYPGGGFTKYNDRTIAAKIYRTGRGARGAPNAANQIDYLSTSAMSSWTFEAGKFPWGNVNNILDPALYNGRYYRGWLVLFSHQANKPLLEQTFKFIDDHREKLWIGLYADVAKYGQERDTATLKVDSSDPNKITLLLTDEMDDTYFNYPLTIKVRLPDPWKTPTATQAGKTVEVKLITHENSPYALVQATPDAGPITLTNQ